MMAAVDSFVKKLVERILHMPFDHEYLEITISENLINYLEEAENKVDENSEFYDDIHHAVYALEEHQEQMKKIMKFYEKMHRIYKKMKNYIKFEKIFSESDEDEIGEDSDVSDEGIEKFLSNNEKFKKFLEELEEYFNEDKESLNDVE
jgi:uncharacterized FlaG/YvyC family protein